MISYYKEIFQENNVQNDDPETKYDFICDS